MFFDYEAYEYYICPQSVDMRCGALKLSQIVIAQMELDPLSKKMFLFTGKTRKGCYLAHYSIAILAQSAKANTCTFSYSD